MTHKPAIDTDRLWADVTTLATITDPAKPYTRRSFTPLFDQGRAWLAERFEDAGLTTRIDAAGNLIGRREGKSAAGGTIAVGSHSDTVPSGGRFDGIAGVAVGLEVARALRDGNTDLQHALEVVDFLAEEPSEYGLSCVGSRGMAGVLDATMLSLTDPTGETLRDAVRRVGGEPDRLAGAVRTDWRAFLELHIEQGIVLEQGRIDAGIVTAIAGIRRLEIVFDGAADHAGSTPMHLRRDALVAAARTVAFVRDRADAFERTADRFFLATVGVLDVAPGAANVVPGRCRLVIDTRTSDAAFTDAFVAALDQATQEFAAAARVERTRFTVLSNGAPVQCDPGLQNVLQQSAASLGFSTVPIASGAGHDAAFISRICPAAMLFIPCRAGKSHAPEEWAEPAALGAGAAILLDAVMTLDRTLPRS